MLIFSNTKELDLNNYKELMMFLPKLGKKGSGEDERITDLSSM